MRKPIRLAGILALLAAPLAARGEEPPLPQRTLPRPVPPVIGTHQIDRYDAIANLQQTLKANPKSLADWVILGELTHEVALDLPAEQAAQYFRMSSDAYDKALALSPNNPGLKAAVQFAKDHESNATKYEASRDQAATAYLDARRRDLAANNYSPSLRVYGQPTGMPATAMTSAVPATTPNSLTPGVAPTTTTGVGTVPAATTTTVRATRTAAAPPINPDTSDNNRPGAAGTTDPSPADTDPSSIGTSSANFGTRQIYSYPTYQEYYVPSGAPYTYNQHSNGYYVSGNSINPALLPMTLQRYSQQLSQPVPQRVPQRALPSSVR